MIEVIYDGGADALYIGLGSRSGRVHTYMTERHHDIAADVVDGQLAGLEILGASKHPIFSRLIPEMQGAVLTSFRTVFP